MPHPLLQLKEGKRVRTGLLGRNQPYWPFNRVRVRFHVTYVFRPLLAERVAATVKKGAHVLVEGSLVSSVYLPANGKSKKNKPTKITSWTIRADAVRRLDRGDLEPQAPASGTSEPSSESSEAGTF